MKLALLDVQVTGISGTEFDDGGKSVKIGLEGGYSFNVSENSPLINKIAEGYTMDITYTFDRVNEKQTDSGTTVVYHNLQGVKIVPGTIKPGELNKELEGLPDVENKITFRKVGGGTTGGGAATPPPKV